MHPLQRAREARGWSRSEFAGLVRRRGSLRGVPLGTGKDGVYRWERGREPDRATQTVIADLLDIPHEALEAADWPIWLDADPARQPADYAWDTAGAVQALCEITRTGPFREAMCSPIVTGTRLTASLWEWWTADPVAAGQVAQGRRIGEAALAHIERRVRELRSMDDMDGGGSLIEEAGSGLTMVVQLLRTRSYTDALGSRLYQAAAEFARIRAWALFDVRLRCADTVFAAALHAAQAAGDAALGAHVLAFWSIAARNCGRPADAEAMASAALSAVRSRATPRVEAMLLSRRARARAERRDTSCWRDLARADDLLGREPRDGGPVWAAWFDGAELAGSLASAQLDMGREEDAARTFSDAVDLLPERKARTRALLLARQAKAQWLQGELDGACVAAHQALDLAEVISSRRAAGPLRRLVSPGGGHDGVPAVRGLRERASYVLDTV